MAANPFLLAREEAFNIVELAPRYAMFENVVLDDVAEGTRRYTLRRRLLGSQQTYEFEYEASLVTMIQDRKNVATQLRELRAVLRTRCEVEARVLGHFDTTMSPALNIH